MEHLDRFLGRLQRVVKRGRGWKASCPCHEDPTQSLSVSLGEGGRILFFCHAGCDRLGVLTKIGLKWRDLYANKKLTGAIMQQYQEPGYTRDLDVLHAVYSELVGSLGLHAYHVNDLVARGLSRRDISIAEYATVSNDYIYLAPELLEKWGDKVWRVPGVWWGVPGRPIFKSPAGLVIPVRNSERFITAIQLRTDSGDPKYWWPAGTGCPVHVPLSVTISPDHPLWIVEGPLKADVVAAIAPGLLVTSVASVSTWKSILPALKQWGVKQVVTAFDADWQTKQPVREQLEAFEEKLVYDGHRVQRAVWDINEGKGLDDLLHNGGSYQLVEVSSGWESKQAEG